MGEHAAIVTGASGGIGLQTKSVDSATKADVIGFTRAIAKPLNGGGIKAVPLAPGFVDTPVTELAHMIRTEEIAEAARLLLQPSPDRVVPEIVFQRATESLWIAARSPIALR
jgi:NAD(P)-dependent dehydrogenase (short-subunit alcohol dehydrogenase family)